MEECGLVDSSNIDGFKTEFIEAHMNYGYEIENIEVICGDSSGESNNSNKDAKGSSDDSNKDSNEDSDDSNKEPSNSDKNSSGTFANIFRISNLIFVIILFV